jgi:hypothetical protein
MGAISGVGGLVHAVISDLLLSCCNAIFFPLDILCLVSYGFA